MTKFFSNVANAIGMGETFFLYAGFAAGCTLFVWFIVPETKGKSFNEIQRLLSGERNEVNQSNSFATNSTLNSIVA